MLHTILHTWFFFGALAVTLFSPSQGSAGGSSSSSSSSSSFSCASESSSSSIICGAGSEKYAPNIMAPPYISSKHHIPEMNVAVLNRSAVINSNVLKRVLKVLERQVKKDFSPFYGINVKFKIVENQTIFDWTKYVPLIIDDLLPTTAGCGFISFHSIQSVDGNGLPIADAVFNPPPIPIGTPYIVIPIGDGTTCYGIVPAYNLHLPYLPQQFDGLFSQSMSHELLETLHNYTTLLATLDFSGELFGPDTIVGFINEVCDPVQFSRGYTMCGFNVANFVLPSYWVADLATGPYDFLNTVYEPFIPFGGEQEILLITPCITYAAVIVSPPACTDDPYDLSVVASPILQCNPTTLAAPSSNTAPEFLKGLNPPQPITLRPHPANRPTRIHTYAPFKNGNRTLTK